MQTNSFSELLEEQIKIVLKNARGTPLNAEQITKAIAKLNNGLKCLAQNVEAAAFRLAKQGTIKQIGPQTNHKNEDLTRHLSDNPAIRNPNQWLISIC